MLHLKQLLPIPVYTFEEKGFDSKHREALCFAVLGYLRYLELPNILRQTTGARKNAIAGKITLPSKG
jgi:anhydro-N-acetylmuramic acid kinase